MKPKAKRTSSTFGAALLLSRRQAADALGLNVRTLDALVRTGQLASAKIGRRRLIPPLALERFVLRRTA